MTSSDNQQHPAAKLTALVSLGADTEHDEPMEGHIRIAEFEGAPVRGHYHGSLWWLSIIDVIAALKASTRPSKYWTDLRTKLIDTEGFSELSDKSGKLKMPSEDGKLRGTEAVTVETLLRVLQSVPSPKVEPLKQWLAKVGFERIQEFDDPSKALERLVNIYLSKDRTPDWIRERIDGIMTRRELTDEWKARGIKKDTHYSILTRMLQKRTVGMGPKEHRQHKRIKDTHSLRDYSTELELLFTRLGARSTIEIARANNAHGYDGNRDAVKAGGEIAKSARVQLEELTGLPVASMQNFLPKPDTGPALK